MRINPLIPIIILLEYYLSYKEQIKAEELERTRRMELIRLRKTITMLVLIISVIGVWTILKPLIW